MSGTTSKRLYARQDEEQCLCLISAVEKQPILYNKKLRSYKNKVLQNDAWTVIASEIGMAVSEAKQLWKHLLSSYRTYRSKVRKSIQTGAAHSEVYRPKWFAYAAMSFLGNVMEDDGHVDTLDEHDEDLALHSLNPSGFAPNSPSPNNNPPNSTTPTPPAVSCVSFLAIDHSYTQSHVENPSPCPGPSGRSSPIPCPMSTSIDNYTPSPSLPSQTPSNPKRKRRRTNEGSEASEVLKDLMEATMANANSPANTFGRWVSEFLRRFTPEEQEEVTSRIQRAMLEAEDIIKAKRTKM